MSNNKKQIRITSFPEAIEIIADCVKNGVTDKGIQKILHDKLGHKWSIDTIRRARKKNLGITKIGKEVIKENKVESKSPILTSPPPGLNVFEKAEWYRKQFKMTHLHETIKKQFTDDEVLTYLSEFGDLCCQFEDIVMSEFFQIDDFLKHRILINRQLITSKSIEQEMEEIREWISNNPPSDDELTQDKQFRSLQFKKLEDQYKILQKSNERYDKLMAEGQKMYNNLAATRKDRIEELRGGRESFFSLLALIQHSEGERNKQGKYAELTKIASEDALNYLRQPQEFPDGSVDAIILDDKTDFSKMEE